MFEWNYGGLAKKDLDSEDNLVIVYKRRTNMCRLLTTLVLALLLYSTGTASAVAAPDSPIRPVSRQAFARQMSHVQIGMTKEQVKKLLGTPEYIGHVSFPSVQPDVSLVWFYGCVDQRNLPTLGTVAFDHHDHVSETWGSEPAPPPPTVISEKELRQALSLLAQMSSRNPAAIIRVVNGLLPFGKAKILAAIKEYRRTASWLFPQRSREWQLAYTRSLKQNPSSFRPDILKGPANPDELIFLLRVIFDIPGGTKKLERETEPMPIPAIGMMLPVPPKDARIAPRFPIVIIDDVPFLELYRTILPSGLPEQVEWSLPYFSQHGILRTHPLRPPDQIETLLERLQSSPQWLVGRRYEVTPDFPNNSAPMFYEPNEEVIKGTTDNIKEEILCMVSSLYPTVFGLPKNLKRLEVSEDLADSLDFVNIVEQWDDVMEDIKMHPVRWNPVTNAYERVMLKQ